VEKLNKFRSPKMSHKDEREGEELSGDERCADLLLSIHGSSSTVVGCRDVGASCGRDGRGCD
jgi:hypothetical protein